MPIEQYMVFVCRSLDRTHDLFDATGSLEKFLAASAGLDSCSTFKFYNSPIWVFPGEKRAW